MYGGVCNNLSTAQHNAIHKAILLGFWTTEKLFCLKQSQLGFPFSFPHQLIEGKLANIYVNYPKISH